MLAHHPFASWSITVVSHIDCHVLPSSTFPGKAIFKLSQPSLIMSCINALLSQSNVAGISLNSQWVTLCVELEVVQTNKVGVCETEIQVFEGFGHEMTETEKQVSNQQHYSQLVTCFQALSHT